MIKLIRTERSSQNSPAAATSQQLGRISSTRFGNAPSLQELKPFQVFQYRFLLQLFSRWPRTRQSHHGVPSPHSSLTSGSLAPPWKDTICHNCLLHLCLLLLKDLQWESGNSFLISIIALVGFVSQWQVISGYHRRCMLMIQVAAVRAWHLYSFHRHCWVICWQWAKKWVVGCDTVSQAQFLETTGLEGDLEAA